jgi:phosphotriesterase-related protein
MDRSIKETWTLEGKAQTVLGPLDPQHLGITLPHEHILADARWAVIEPVGATDRAKVEILVAPDMPMKYLGWLNYNWMSNRDNLRLSNEELAIAEIELFRRAGGQTIVDMTPIGLGRDPSGLARIARATWANIIAGTGFSSSRLHPPELETMTVGEISEMFITEITKGFLDGLQGVSSSLTGTGSRAGIIGEIGCTWPLGRNEEKVLQGAAKAQRLTGAPLSFNPGWSEESILGIIDVLKDAGADPSRIIVSHVDRTTDNLECMRKCCKAGCYLSFDEFSIENNYPLSDFDLPNDYYRVRMIMHLIADGLVEHILISHDIIQKTRYVAYGGNGYGHILNNIVPRMRRKGMVEEHIRTILVKNPARCLTFGPPKKI